VHIIYVIFWCINTDINYLLHFSCRILCSNSNSCI